MNIKELLHIIKRDHYSPEACADFCLGMGELLASADCQTIGSIRSELSTACNQSVGEEAVFLRSMRGVVLGFEGTMLNQYRLRNDLQRVANLNALPAMVLLASEPRTLAGFNVFVPPQDTTWTELITQLEAEDFVEQRQQEGGVHPEAVYELSTLGHALVTHLMKEKG